ncbi:MAG: NAD(P)H-hydrate dehydratase [Planctomycetes bacterium]|nr:NAD(P)H-hydrate dehydratase [Planctomycetota bacterium]
MDEFGHQLPKLPPRRPDGHKGDFGRVLVVAGSPAMTGAAYLAAEAAVRGGAGLVTLATARPVHPILAIKLTGPLVRALPATPAGGIAAEAAAEVLELARGADVVALGPGLGMEPATVAFVHALLPAIPVPVVLDADGLNALAQNVDLLAQRPAPTILTPHPGEMGRLLRLDARAVQSGRARVARVVAVPPHVVVVLKGHRTVVAGGQQFYENRTGNAGMATGGSGDVLTGLIAALLGQGLAPFAAAQLGVYLHGAAGDLAAAEVGPISLAATDLLAWLPKAILRHHRNPLLDPARPAAPRA